MDTVEMKDANGMVLKIGDRVATAMVSRHSGSGLRQGHVLGMSTSQRYIAVKLINSGREVLRTAEELVKVAHV